MEQNNLQDKDILFLYRNLVERQKNDFLGSLPVKKRKNKGTEEYFIANLTIVYILEPKELPSLAEDNHIYIKLKKNEIRALSLITHLRNAFCHNYFLNVDGKYKVEDYNFFDENNKKSRSQK